MSQWLKTTSVSLRHASGLCENSMNLLWRITKSLFMVILLTYKMPVRYILSSEWVRLSIFSPLSIIQYVGLYVFSLSIYLVMIERIYIICLIIIIKSEVWTITHCLGLGHETMVSAVCLSIFLLLPTPILRDVHLVFSPRPITLLFVHIPECCFLWHGP